MSWSQGDVVKDRSLSVQVHSHKDIGDMTELTEQQEMTLEIHS